MSDEPKGALYLIKKSDLSYHTWWQTQAAAELRRLHALCDEMGEVLRKARGCFNETLSPQHAAWAKEIDTTLAKWKESK